MSHLDYSAMVKQRSLGGDHITPAGDDASSAFLDALRTQAMDELHQAALEYGIVLKDLGKRISSSRPCLYSQMESCRFDSLFSTFHSISSSHGPFVNNLCIQLSLTVSSREMLHIKWRS